LILTNGGDCLHHFSFVIADERRYDPQSIPLIVAKSIGEQNVVRCFASLIGNNSANDLLCEGQRHGLRVALRLPAMTMG
jgi:hypothetical protein